jgi:hypothetical protein
MRIFSVHEQNRTGREKPVPGIPAVGTPAVGTPAVGTPAAVNPREEGGDREHPSPSPAEEADTKVD